MKKNITNLSLSNKSRFLKIIMKTFIFVFSIAVFSLSPKGGFSQNVEIEIKDNQAITVDEVFKLIKNQTEYRFVYRSDLFENYPKVTLKKGLIKANELLESALSNGEFIYEFSNENTIVIKNKVVENEQEVKAEATVQKLVVGIVTDENGVPLPGVNVIIKGERRGVATDFDGGFKINLANKNENPTLIFSFIGYEQQEVEVGSKTTINIKMVPSFSGLDEVLVIGYGTTKVRDATGVISRIDKQDIEDAPMVFTVESLLEGKASGVNVQVESASPTSPINIVIRGSSSLDGNNQPLWVIDGVPQDGLTLDDLNIDTIESIDILKDASSTAVYGSRGSQGVVMVTTKKGLKNRAPIITFSTSTSATFTDFNSFEYFDGPQYESYITAAIKEQILTRGWEGDAPNFIDQQAFWALNTSEYDKDDLQLLPSAFFGGNTDWQEVVTQTPINLKHDVSIRGGSEKTTYYASLGLRDIEGVVKTGYNNTITGSVRLDTDISEKFKFGLNIRGATTKRSNKDRLLTVLNRIRPDIEPYNDDGSIFTPGFFVENPLTALANTNEANSITLNTSAYLEYEVLKGLKLKSTFANSYSDFNNLSYARRGTYQEELGQRNWSNNKTSRDVFDNTLNYTTQINRKHDITALLGHTLEKYVTRGYGIIAEDFPDDDILNNFGSQASITQINETEQRSALIGMFARLHYKYDDRYILSGTIRRDGSSRFGSGKQWGVFPSGAFAWTVTNEKFMKSDKIKKYLSYAKLRTSIGITGSTGGLGFNDWATGVTAVTYNDNPALFPSSLGNPFLQWEETTMLDFGLDLGFFNDRITLTIGTYSKKSEKLIYSNDIPWSSAQRDVFANVATMEAKGYEIDLNADIIKTKNSRFTFDFNWSKNRSKITSINANIDQLVLSASDPRMVINVGDEIGEWFGYQTAGRFYVTPEDAYAFRNSTNEQGVQEPYYSDNEGMGDLIYIDNSGIGEDGLPDGIPDGQITEADRKHLGSAVPDGYGGFGFTYNYKNFRINTNFTYAYGHLRLWAYPRNTASFGLRDYNNSVNIAGQSAVVQSPYDALFPRLTVNTLGTNGLFSDFYLYDASFIRLNSLSMNYTIPEKVFKNSKIAGVDLSFRASNLFTLTNYPGFKPDGGATSTSSVSVNSSQDSSTYPAASVFSLGLKVNLK